MTNEEKFEKIKNSAEAFYKKQESVYCPYFKKAVNFNAKGLDHIKLKSWNKARLISDQYLRFKFLRLAPTVIESSGTLQEVYERNVMERVKNVGKWQFAMKPVTYYGFIAIVNSVKIKIVVKKIEGGQPYFWSIIPFWKNQKDEINQEIKKVFHEGDLETQ